jgi:hypothetical protein
MRVEVFGRRYGVRGAVKIGVAVLGPLFVMLGAAPAWANSGAVVATQNCQTWHVSVSLNHDTTPDRSVDVVTTIPGTTGITGGHYNTSFGEIWSADGAAPTTGTVTLNIYYPDGGLEFTEIKSLPVPEDCATTTSTTAAATTTTMGSTTTIATEGTTVTTGSTATTTPTIAVEGNNASAPSTARPTAAMPGGTSAVAGAEINTLPRTGTGNLAPAIGMTSLLIGAVLLQLSRRASSRQ